MSAINDVPFIFLNKAVNFVNDQRFKEIRITEKCRVIKSVHRQTIKKDADCSFKSLTFDLLSSGHLNASGVKLGRLIAF